MSLKTVLITGLAGAGKSTALNAFEDMGYYCIDNLPCFLVEELLKRRRTAGRLDRLVLVMDSRDPCSLNSCPALSRP